MKRRENQRPTDAGRPPEHRSEFPTGYSSGGLLPSRARLRFTGRSPE